MSDIISDYLRQRDLYLYNAELFYSKKEYRKSSEMLWGAITQTIKAIASTGNIKIASHKDFFTFMETISKELNEEYYYTEFLKINDLHRNFYDEFIPSDTYYIVHREALKYLEKLNELLESRIKEVTARE